MNAECPVPDFNDPYVSVIVPIYNATATLARAVDSILTQDFADFELILSDDGSTDDSDLLCNRYASADKRVRVIHASNAGPATARNRALEICRGEFLFFLDADDSLAPGALSALVHSQRSNNADIVVGDFCKLIGDQKIESGHARYFSGDTYLDAAALYRYVCDFYLPAPNRYHLLVYVWGRLIRTDLAKKRQLTFNESLHTYEDVAFNFSLLPHVQKLNFVATPVVLKHIDKHDGYAIGKQFCETSGWKHFGYVDAFSELTRYLETKGGAAAQKNNTDIAFTIYTIITLIRLCGHANRKNWRHIHSLIRHILENDRLRAGLRIYSPGDGNSTWIPRLMRWRFTTLLLFVCSAKSRSRYK